MTYCVAISVKKGLIFCSDSRTNAGVDQVSTYSKMYRFGIDGERQFIITTSGNLGTSQTVMMQVKRDITENKPLNLYTMQTMGDAAEYLGNISRAHQNKHNNRGFESWFTIGGQVPNEKPRAMLIYPEGNFITTSKDTPFLQIGESKYGKPILDRILTDDTSLDTAALCALVSMDSTMRSNLTVGPPIELTLYETDSFLQNRYHRFDEGSEYLREVKRSWDEKLKQSFETLPPISWANAHDQGNLQVQQAASHFNPTQNFK